MPLASSRPKIDVSSSLRVACRSPMLSMVRLFGNDPRWSTARAGPRRSTGEFGLPAARSRGARPALTTASNTAWRLYSGRSSLVGALRALTRHVPLHEQHRVADLAIERPVR